MLARANLSCCAVKAPSSATRLVRPAVPCHTNVPALMQLGASYSHSSSCITCTDALLAVAGSLQLAHVTVGVYCAQKHWLELVHSSIGEQQGGVVQRHLQDTGQMREEAPTNCRHGMPDTTQGGCWWGQVKCLNCLSLRCLEPSSIVQ